MSEVGGLWTAQNKYNNLNGILHIKLPTDVNED